MSSTGRIQWRSEKRNGANSLGAWVAWGKRGAIVTDSPMHEPGEVWFEFGVSADDAMAKLARDMGVAV